MAPEFTSFAFQDLSPKEVKKYAKQYEDVDMAALMGVNEDNIPFLLRVDPHSGDHDPTAFHVLVWNAHNGIMAQLDEDPVRYYATARYLHEQGCPIFASFDEAERWATDHKWPRKSRS